jgi:phosphoribosyl 1,2-cyclic phosphodiesterase
MRVWTFASGSTGNCFLVESEGTKLLVECGRAQRDVKRYLDGVGFHPGQLDGILLTHAHFDHARSARKISDKFNVPVFASSGTLGTETLYDSELIRPLTSGKPVTIGEILVKPFAVPHDCVEPLGFRFESHTGSACITTDLGWVPESVQQQFLDLDLLMLEANYDPHLLEVGPYPARLKYRVAGRRGHLANVETARAIAACQDHAPKQVWLGHLSESNNTPKHALRTVSNHLKARGLGHVPLRATKHRRPSLHWDSAGSLEQLTLF